jgi:hypothetical protein
MSGPSPLFAVNTNTAQIAHELIYATEFRLKLDSMSNVDTYEFRVIGWSDNDISNQSLVFTDLGHGEVSGTFYAAPGDTTGRSILVDCIVNGMRNAQGKLDTSLRITRVMGVPAGDGIVPAASGETFERDPKLGWLSLLKRSGGGIGATNVTASGDGTLNAFPAASMRLAGSDGTTAGGEWSVKNKAFLDAALGENSVGLDKLHSGGASNGQIPFFNALTGNWEPGNEQSIPSYPAATVTSVTGSGYATVTHEGTVYNVYVPEPGEPAAETVVMYPSIGSVIHEVDGFDPSAPGDIINCTRAALNQTFFYLSANPNQGPYIVTDNTPGAVVAERHSSWSGIKDLSVKYMWPVASAMDTGAVQCLIFTNNNSGSVTVGTGNIGFSTTLPQNVLSCPKTYQDHPACDAHATIPIVDVFNCPNIIDGIEFSYGAVGRRIFLSKQTDTKENGVWVFHAWHTEDSTWELSRPLDWGTGSLLRAGTTHRFQVLSGTLWPAHIIELYIGDDTYIWGGSILSVGGWSINMTTIPDCDATEGTIAVDADWEYTPRGASGTERKSVRVTGWIKAGTNYRAGIFEGSAQNIPLDVDPNMGSHSGFENAAVDDLSVSWEVFSSSAALYRDTSTKAQGTSSWRMAHGAGTSSPYRSWARRNFTLPANHRARIQAQARKTAVWATGSGTIALRIGEYDPLWAQNGVVDPPSELGNHYVTTTSSWDNTYFDVVATNRSRVISLSFYGYTFTTSTSARDIGWIDAVHFAHTIDGFSSRLYIDAEYGPASDPKCIYYADDTQEEQVDDSSNQLGGPTLCGLDMDTNCRLFMPSLSIERHYAFTMLMTPISEVVTAPGLPAATTLPAYPY